MSLTVTVTETEVSQTELEPSAPEGGAGEESPAELALVAITTLSRDVPFEQVQELVDTIVTSPEHRPLLPVLIMHTRNHSKSLAPGEGAGEKAISESLLAALYLSAPHMCIALLRHLVFYGSWKSLSALLELTDELSGVHPKEENKFSGLQKAIHAIFAEQFVADRQSLDATGAVSNCAKFAPHEKRGATHSDFHADCIARIVFGDDDKLRELYRKMRSKLNKGNQYIAERYLCGNLAEELQPEFICAGAYASMTKALLNMTLDGKAERYDDDGRRQLKEKLVSTMGERPDKIPVPSDIAQLAKSLVACRARLSDASEAEVELDPERKLLGVCYSRAVDDLLARLKGSINKARKMIAQLITDPEEQAAALTQVVANSVRVAIDCTASMAHTHPTCCLMTMLFADVFYADASGPNLDVSMITFSNNARIVPIPPPSLDSPEDRLASMLDSCRAQANNTDGAFNAEQGPTSQASYLAALEAFSAEPSFEGTDLLICSDFVGQSFTEDLAAWKASTEGVSTSVVSCWRMLANRSSRKRGRAISWDPANPLIDVCFVMDTTGSMGTWIHYACSEVRNVVQQVESSSGMPVRCSMVSYKDFGDHRHREVHDWVQASDAAGMASLNNFIGTLQASGGGDTPEDISGGFEEVATLLAGCTAPSIKLVVLIADAPCHGLPNARGDAHVTENGVHQGDKIKAQIREIFVEGGAELMLCQCGNYGGMDEMVTMFDTVLEAGRTFMDVFDVAGTSSNVFNERIVACLESCVAQAVAPPSETDVDLFVGTDFSVLLNVTTARFADQMAKLSASITGEEKAKLSVFEQLVAKLQSRDYDPVRGAMASVSEGPYAAYEWSMPLSKASMSALLRAGLTVDQMAEAGYPQDIVQAYTAYVHSELSSGR